MLGDPLSTMAADRVVAVVRAPRIADPLGLCAALADGGVRCVELTLTAANAVPAIAACAGEGVMVGAGTVTTPAEVEAVAAAGARFVVSPGLSEDVVATCARLGVPVIPGALTPSEVMRAVALDVAAIKVYPAHLAGPGYVTELRRVLGDHRLLPSGGIGIDNAAAFLAAGAFAVGSGSLTPGADVLSGQHETVSRLARQFCTAIADGEGPRRGSG